MTTKKGKQKKFVLYKKDKKFFVKDVIFVLIFVQHMCWS